MQQENLNLISLKWFYMLTFFGVGSISPLMSVYFSDVAQLNGYQIGTLLSIGPIMMIFFQPLWGLIADMKDAHNKLLMITTFVAGIIAMGYLLFDHYYWYLIIAISLGIFQSAIIPLSDSITIKFVTKKKLDYGKIRLYGSLGFAIAVFVMGRLSEFSPDVIFYGFFLSLTIATIFSFWFPKGSGYKKTSKVERSGMFSSLKKLLGIKKFVVFLIVTFMIFGPNLANNFYFSLFIEQSGGTYTGIGIAFLLAVLSEIPFMRFAGKWMNKIGLLQVALIAGIASLVRWVFYFFEPSLILVYATTFVQGFSLGLFIPAGIQYIREVSPSAVTATAVTLYSAIGNGLGNWFCTFVSGVIFEEYSIFVVYLFYSILTLIGVLLTGWLLIHSKREAVQFQSVIPES